jgi:pilus assembly protein CpaB
MDRTRLMIIGLLALALGAFVSYSVYRTLQTRTATNNEPGSDVLVAANDIAVGTKLEDRDLKVIKLPVSGIPPNAVSRKSQVIGRGVIVPINKGEFVLPSKLAGENAGSGLPGLIPPGMRAVSVRVNEVVAVAGFVVPGTRVDVLLTGTPTGGEQQTTTVLENVAVIAAGQRLERSASGEAQQVPVITLLVSPEDAQKLTLASTEGRIQLTLRNPLDTKDEDLGSIKQAALYRNGQPVPVARPVVKKDKPVATTPPPPSFYTVEVIRGTDKKEVKLDNK